MHRTHGRGWPPSPRSSRLTSSGATKRPARCSGASSAKPSPCSSVCPDSARHRCFRLGSFPGCGETATCPCMCASTTRTAPLTFLCRSRRSWREPSRPPTSWIPSFPRPTRRCGNISTVAIRSWSVATGSPEAWCSPSTSSKSCSPSAPPPSQPASGRPGSSAPARDDLAELEVAPPILSLVCRELNSQRLAQGMSQITAPLLTQNADTIIQDFYERSVADQPPEVRAFIEEELLTESGFRENMALEQARRRLAQRGGPVAALDELVRRRLLQTEQLLDVQRIELTHVVLTAAIRRRRDLRRQTETVQLAEQREAAVRAKLRRSRAVFTMAAAVALVMSALAVFSWTSLQADRRGEQHAKDALGQAAAEREKAQKAEERARAKAAEAEKAEEKATAKAAEAERQRKNAVAALAKANSETARARAAEQRTDAEKEAALSLLAKLTDSMYSAFKDNESIRA